ncbi:MAG: sugar phosphate isomerase/epimerase family protein [Anaerolineales bacterium]
MTRIGIMEGRLFPPEAGRFQSFPRDHWADEYLLAAQAGLDCIEWIYDLYGADVNPLATDAGVEQMKLLSKKHGVRVLSLCADYFMDKPLVRANPVVLIERLATLKWLMARCKLLGMNRIVIPFVDASRIDTDEEFDEVCATLTGVLPVAADTGIEIHLESSLPPNRFAELLARLPHPKLKVNYDSGNSSSLGFKVQDEFSAYGKRIGSVHIKDRLFGGSTVPIGKGDADFPALAESLKSIRYSGDFILQVARETPGNEVIWARQNRDFVQKNFVEFLMERQ